MLGGRGKLPARNKKRRRRLRAPHDRVGRRDAAKDRGFGRRRAGGCAGGLVLRGKLFEVGKGLTGVLGHFLFVGLVLARVFAVLQIAAAKTRQAHAVKVGLGGALTHCGIEISKRVGEDCAQLESPGTATVPPKTERSSVGTSEA